ncbi:MAG: peptidoglycan DD-metalloendopeptidase family protein [Bacteroidia bacterium]|nr:peptidoglycan DD-metalloendopeptidase family protein [Bacteroidia bacterium]
MKKSNRHIALFLAFVFLYLQLNGQSSRSELEKQRKKTEEQIAITKKILKETKSKKQKSLKEITTLARLIESRESLLQTISAEISLVSRDVEFKKDEIDSLNSQIDLEKKNYAKAIVQTYKSKKVYNNALYLFTAKSFNQWILRVKFGQYLSRAQELFLERIRIKKDMLDFKLKELIGLKQSKELLATNKRKEVNELEKDKKEKNRVVQALTGKEAELKAKLAKQQKAKDALNAKINAIIAQELKKAREAQAKKLAQKSKDKTKGGENTKPDANVPTVTPEVRELSDNFALNKGKLPWPVEKGFISERFGTHAHEKLDQVTIQNNGIDIQTTAGAGARCVHKGNVTAVIYIPGMGNTVIISHGEYFTVYSKLKSVSVSQGQNVTLKQVIGTVAEDEDGSTEIHFELWYNQDKQNPESWLAKK